MRNDRISGWLCCLMAAVPFIALPAAPQEGVHRIAGAPAWGDLGDGMFANPVLNADYSDPDIVRVGDKYYLTCSEFHFMGMPILESEDLVNWRIVGQIFDRIDLPGYSDMTKYAEGTWAPALKEHDGKVWMYVCTPEEGLFMSRAERPEGPWEPLHMVKGIAKWEDPCPFWDEDGQAYLVRSRHRAGPIIIHRMSADGRELLDEGVTVYEGPVAEGPKMFKKDGWYYISIPEGGVGEGWQTILRSRDIYGPYESRRVLEQGMTAVNGPHQGSLVETPEGEWWFAHFQSAGARGRVMHLQPVRWVDGWPEIGEDFDGNGIGEPMHFVAMPGGKPGKRFTPQTSDEFDDWRGGLLTSLCDGLGLSEGRAPALPAWQHGASEGRAPALPVGQHGASEGRAPALPVGQHGASEGRAPALPAWQHGASEGRAPALPAGQQGASEGRAPALPRVGLGLQWQTNHNPVWDRISVSNGWLTLRPLSATRLREARNQLTQKLMGYKSEAETAIDWSGMKPGDRSGLLCIGKKFVGAGIEMTDSGPHLYIEEDSVVLYRQPLAPDPSSITLDSSLLTLDSASSASPHLCVSNVVSTLRVRPVLAKGNILIRLDLDTRANRYAYTYSIDGGKVWEPLGEPFEMRDGYWKGVRVGLYAYTIGDEPGETRFDWFRYLHDGNVKGSME